MNITLPEVKDALSRLKDLNDGEQDELTAALQPSIDILEKMVKYLSPLTEQPMFKPDTTFNSSHKMGDARINYNYALGKFGEGDTDNADGKCSNHWSGSFTAKDGTVMRASFWDWKGGLKAGYGVSVWVDKPEYLPEFIRYIEV